MDRSKSILDVGYDGSVVIESEVDASTDIGGFLVGKDCCYEFGEVGMTGGLCDDSEIAQSMVEMMPSPTVSNLTVVIGFELPKKLSKRFQSKATFKRVTKTLAEVTESSENGSGNGSDAPPTGGGNSGSGSTTGGDNNGGENTDPEG